MNDAALAEKLFSYIEHDILLIPIYIRKSYFGYSPSTPRKYPTDFASYIGEEIGWRRWLKKITQEQLAEMIHVNVSQVSRHENGKQLTLKILPLYAKALECSVHDLLPLDDDEIINESHKRINQIVDRFPELQNMPSEQREYVFRIVESTLSHVLRGE